VPAALRPTFLRPTFAWIACVASLCAQAALNSPPFWDVRDVEHPKMGTIRVAVPSKAIETPVGKEKIVSLVFFSCEKSRGRIAIELANAPESDPKGGLPPKVMPKLICNSREAGATPQAEIATSWNVSSIGDALARGLPPSALRRCASIEIQQTIALPKGWARDTERVDVELIPYHKEIESVLNECGAVIAAAPSQPSAPAAPSSPPPSTPTKPATSNRPLPSPAPAPAAAPSTQVGEADWKSARTISSGGRTNVRASPSTTASVVVMLSPGQPLLAQPAGGDWYRVKPTSGTAFAGYIRQDRLVFESR